MTAPIQRRALVQADLIRMNVPKQFWYTRLEKVQSQQAVIARYLEQITERVEKAQGLLLFGSPGVGKTSIASMILREARAHGYTGYFTSVYELREAIRLNEEFEGDVSVLARCREVDVLVLDNLQESDADERFYLNPRALADLLTYRRANMRLSVVTGSLNPASLKQRLPQVAGAASGYMLPLEITGENLRKDAAEDIAKSILGK